MNKNVLLKELDLIQNPLIKRWTKDTLQNVPDYFFYGMVSSTGKYHPACTCQKHGLLIHVKRAVYFANRLCDGYGIKGIDHDIVISAIILHDIAKMPSPKDDPKITYADYENHPINAIKYFKSYVTRDVGEIFTIDQIDFLFNIVEEIIGCVQHHMGLWTPKSIRKPLSEYTQLELTVYTADYMSATKDLITPVDNLEGIQE
jgi:HD superfamily phosphohydrolase YqeK